MRKGDMRAVKEVERALGKECGLGGGRVTALCREDWQEIEVIR